MNLPGIRDFINEFAKFLKSIGVIFGVLAAVYLFLANLFPDAGLFRFVARITDPLVAGGAPERFSSGFIYYEEDGHGGPTPRGQFQRLYLRPASSPEGDFIVYATGRPAFSDLSESFIMETSGVAAIYTGPSFELPVARELGADQCLLVHRKVRDANPSELRTGASGGWLEATEVSCDALDTLLVD